MWVLQRRRLVPSLIPHSSPIATPSILYWCSHSTSYSSLQPDPSPACQLSYTASVMTLEDDIRQAENGAQVGWDKEKRMWLPYKSVEGGTKTISYGHKCTPTEQKKWEEEGLSEDQADELFRTDLATASADVTALLTAHHIDALSAGAMAALTEMAYNIGRTKLNGFVKMWAALAKKPPNYDEAAEQMKKSKWYDDVKAARGDRMIASMKRDKAADSVANK